MRRRLRNCQNSQRPFSMAIEIKIATTRTTTMIMVISPPGDNHTTGAIARQWADWPVRASAREREGQEWRLATAASITCDARRAEPKYCALPNE